MVATDAAFHAGRQVLPIPWRRRYVKATEPMTWNQSEQPNANSISLPSLLFPQRILPRIHAALLALLASAIAFPLLGPSDGTRSP